MGIRRCWHWTREHRKQLARWGGGLLSPKKIDELLAYGQVWVCGWVHGNSVRSRSTPKRHSPPDSSQIAHNGGSSVGHGAFGSQAQGKVVGVPTACVLWVCTGIRGPLIRRRAYRKAMGLNLAERSSGTYQGPLRISKRGSARTRQWLYFAVLRLVQKCGVRPWYEAKKARDEGDARRVLVAVMRKLAVALYHVGVRNEEFQPRRLLAGSAGVAAARPCG